MKNCMRFSTFICFIPILLAGCQPNKDQNIGSQAQNPDIQKNEAPTTENGTSAVENTVQNGETIPLSPEKVVLQEGDICDAASCTCGENQCSYGASCIQGQCQDVEAMDFGYGRIIKPIPFEMAMKYPDPGSIYWDCRTDSCDYNGISIPKGAGIFGDIAVCAKQKIDLGMPNIKLEEVKDATCSEKNGWAHKAAADDDTAYSRQRWGCTGWEDSIIESCGYDSSNMCISPDGCVCTGPERFRVRDAVLCSPGDICNPGSWCEFKGTDEFVKCEEGNCECGQNHCGKGETCAFGNCYFNGKIDNNHPKCRFNNDYGMCGGTSDTEHLFEDIDCTDLTIVNAQNGYESVVLNSFDICADFEINLMKCTRKEGCPCGDKTCPENAFCRDNMCVLPGFESLNSFQLQPDDDNYVVTSQDSWKTLYSWICKDGESCQCGGKTLPANAQCIREINQPEFIACQLIHSDYMYPTWAPTDVQNYECLEYKNNSKYEKEIDHKWFCKSGAKCLCNGLILPPSAECKVQINDGKIHEVIWCGQKEIHGDVEQYVCVDNHWQCAKEGECTCNGQKLPANTVCDSNKAVCGNSYRDKWDGCKCDSGKWQCSADDTALCNGRKLPANTVCKKNDNDTETAVCGDVSRENWDGCECNSGKWECRCYGVILPPGSSCRYGKIECGHDPKPEDLSHYQCENKTWICRAENDQTCSCGPRNIQNGEICDKAAQFLHDRHIVEVSKEKIIPGYYQKQSVVSKLRDNGEICNRKLGCICQDKWCPVTGICTDKGCIDSLTNAPFLEKDGYLISGQLKQCISENGCLCGSSTIPVHEYCVAGQEKTLINSAIYQGKRIVAEENFTVMMCEYKLEFELENDTHIPFNFNENPDEYVIRDCVRHMPDCGSDITPEHIFPKHECVASEGCHCGKSICKKGQACLSNQCFSDLECESGDEEITGICLQDIGEDD